MSQDIDIVGGVKTPEYCNCPDPREGPELDPNLSEEQKKNIQMSCTTRTNTCGKCGKPFTPMVIR